ncbi:hypothetical protein F0U59_17520 [Archangium gephyra]|nr:hypothetical protein F0U59_17520 [Archangium gephyra]
MFRRELDRSSSLRGLLAVLLLACTGCSLVVDANANQCVTDADCVTLDSAAICQEGVCVPSGLGPPGCFLGEPSSEEQFLNRCTNSQCIPFDNCARLGLCNGAALPPLVARP